MNPPNKLLVVSDSNEMQYVETITPNRANKLKEARIVYRYTVSRYKLGTTLSLTEKEIKSLLSNGTMKQML